MMPSSLVERRPATCGASREPASSPLGGSRAATTAPPPRTASRSRRRSRAAPSASVRSRPSAGPPGSGLRTISPASSSLSSRAVIPPLESITLPSSCVGVSPPFGPLRRRVARMSNWPRVRWCRPGRPRRSAPGAGPARSPGRPPPSGDGSRSGRASATRPIIRSISRVVVSISVSLQVSILLSRFLTTRYSLGNFTSPQSASSTHEATP